MKGSQDMTREIRRTRPDMVIHAAGSPDGSTGDTVHKRLLVFDGPDGRRFCVRRAATGSPWCSISSNRTRAAY